MSEVTIVEVRHVLWRTLNTEHGLLPRLSVKYSDGHTEYVDLNDISVKGYTGIILPYELSDELLLIDAERDRRIKQGIVYPDGSGRVIQTRTKDMENITQQMLRALAMAISDPSAWGSRYWLDQSNADPLPLNSAQDMIKFALYVGDVKEFLIFRAFEIKQMRRAGIAVDWTSDAAWAKPVEAPKAPVEAPAEVPTAEEEI